MTRYNDERSAENENRGMTAPLMDHLVGSSREWEMCVDEATKELVLALFKVMQDIEICGSDELRELWLTVPRGAIEDFGDYEEYLEADEVSNREEFERLWLDYYPEPVKWYEIATVHYRGWYSVFINHKLVLQIQPEPGRKYPENKVELAEWLLSEVPKVIETVKDGTYNEYVRQNLPYAKRTGKILREDYWRIDPEIKTADLEDISQEEIARFLMLSESAPEKPDGRIPEMTLGKYLDYCRMGYEANGSRGVGVLDNRGLYRANADGRDQGLLELSLDSA